MAACRWVYDSRHLQAECQELGSAPEPYARQSSIGCLYLFYWYVWRWVGKSGRTTTTQRTAAAAHSWCRPTSRSRCTASPTTSRSSGSTTSISPGCFRSSSARPSSGTHSSYRPTCWTGACLRRSLPVHSGTSTSSHTFTTWTPYSLSGRQSSNWPAAKSSRPFHLRCLDTSPKWQRHRLREERNRGSPMPLGWNQCWINILAGVACVTGHALQCLTSKEGYFSSRQ